MSCDKFWSDISVLYQDLTVQIALNLVSVLRSVKIFSYILKCIHLYPL